MLESAKQVISASLGILLIILCMSFSKAVFADVQTVTGSYNYDAAYQMLSLINQTRESKGLGPLVYDSSLENFAKQRAAEISLYNSHVRPDGSNTLYAENYSIGWGSAGEAHAAFVNSPGHFRNITGNFTAMGGASFTVNGQTYWVQVFSASGTASGPGGSGVVTESREVITANAPGSQKQYDNLDDSLTLKVGSYIKVSASVNGQMSSGTWSSDNPGIASVNSSGKISGVSPGVCLITGNISGISKRIQVTVVQSGTAPQAPAPAQNAPSSPPPPPSAPSPTNPPSEQAPPTELVQASDELISEQGSTPLTAENDTLPEASTAQAEQSSTLQTAASTETSQKPSESATVREQKRSEKSSEKNSGKQTGVQDSENSSTEKSSPESSQNLKSFDKATKEDKPSKFMTFLADGATGDRKTDTIIFIASLSGFVIAGSLLIHLIKLKR